jgi:dTDP-4-dehydrorhamnose reductase
MKKKKIVIIAPTGMLGNAVYNQLQEKYELVLLYRKKDFLKLLPDYNNHVTIQCDLEVLYSEYKTGFAAYVNSTLSNIVKKIGKIDGIINCAGLTKPHSLQNPELTFFINGAFPHILSEIYKEKLIQIATDCVFDGNEHAPYDENASKFPTDLYGLSKSLGEPSENSLVLRTSIIGEELHGDTLLISWLLKQRGEVFGFTNHFWNGITTKQFAKICDEIIAKREKYPQCGLFHIFSNDVTKYEMLEVLKKKYNLPIAIVPKEMQKVDRRLRTIHSLNEQLRVPNFEIMMKEL